MLNCLVNRQLSKKGEKLIAFFVDLRAAFDSVDREILVGAMTKRGIKERLIERVVEILRETISRVRVGGEEEEKFWTARGVRQGCTLSSILFNILLADLEEEQGKVKWEGCNDRGGEDILVSVCR